MHVEAIADRKLSAPVPLASDGTLGFAFRYWSTDMLPGGAALVGLAAPSACKRVNLDARGESKVTPNCARKDCEEWNCKSDHRVSSTPCVRPVMPDARRRPSKKSAPKAVRIPPSRLTVRSVAEEAIVPDQRSGVTPAQSVERKLSSHAPGRRRHPGESFPLGPTLPQKLKRQPGVAASPATPTRLAGHANTTRTERVRPSAVILTSLPSTRAPSSQSSRTSLPEPPFSTRIS